MSRCWYLVVGSWMLAQPLEAQVPDSTLVSRPVPSVNLLKPERIEAWPAIGDPDSARQQYMQDLSHRFGPSGARHHMLIEAHGMYDSNVLRNELVMGLWRGEDLGRDLRQRSQRTSQAANRAGYVLEMRMSYAWGEALFGDSTMRPRLSASSCEVMGLRYADDLYNLTFFGNAGYENRVAELGPGSLQQVRYQTFGFGVEDKASRSYLMLQLVNGQRLTAANIGRADLFTGIDGRYLRLDVDGDLARSDTAGKAFTTGLGLAISAEMIHAFGIGRRTAEFTMGVYDLGAIAWNGNALRVPKDSTLIYDGIGVEDVIDLDGVVVGDEGLQDTLGLGYERGAFLRPLPVRMLARLRVGLADRIDVTAQVEVRALPGFLPRATLAGDHRFGRNERVRLQVSEGGFGGWRAGVAWEHRFCKALRAMLAVENGLGLVSANARGKSLSLGVELEW